MSRDVHGEISEQRMIAHLHSLSTGEFGRMHKCRVCDEIEAVIIRQYAEKDTAGGMPDDDNPSGT